jgi:hypothetical protein
VKVAVSPVKKQPPPAGGTVKKAVKQDALVTVMTGVLTVLEVRVPALSRAEAVKVIVPAVAPVL